VDFEENKARQLINKDLQILWDKIRKQLTSVGALLR